MAITDRRKWLSIALTCCSLLLYFTVGRYAAAPVAIISFFIISYSPNKSGVLFSIAVFFTSACMGFFTDYPYDKFPAATLALLLFPLALHLRTWLFPWIGINHSGVDFAVGLLLLAGYVAGAWRASYDLFQWLASGIPALQWGFLAFVIYADRAGAGKMVSAFKVQPGTVAPEFSLPDQEGNMVSLKKILEEHHALLIFVRGDWCPTCHMMLRGYVKNKERFAEKNVRIIGVGPDPQGVNRDIMNRIDPSSLLLADHDQLVAEQYVIRLQQNNPVTKPLYKNGIPLPASFLVHRSGKIIFTSRSDKAGEILQPEKIFAALGALA